MHPQSSERRIQRIRHELRHRQVTVAKVEPLSADMVRITFSGDALADFVSLSFDDHVKFTLTTADGETVRRDYTPVGFQPEACTLAIEFALHGHGVASSWARAAQPGQQAIISGPRGSMVIPTDYAWHLLVGDSSALPAIRRRLQELPAGAQAIAVVHGQPSTPPDTFACDATLSLHWVSDADALLRTVAGLTLPAGDGFVWAAGEASSMRALRTLLQEEKQLPKQQMRIAVYWKQGSSDFHERLDD